MKNIFKALFVSAILMVGCGDDEGSPMSGGGGGGDDGVIAASADYSLTLEMNFTEDLFPTDYPANPSFGPIVIITHAPSVSVFALGQLASEGFEAYAEEGDVGALGAFISTELGEEGDGLFAISTNTAVGPESFTNLSATVTPSRTRITVLARINPSPDWFVGVNSFDVIDGQELVDEAIFSLTPIDAGTDAGMTYNAEDAEDNLPIANYQDLPFGEGVFPSLGTLTFSRTN